MISMGARANDSGRAALGFQGLEQGPSFEMAAELG